MSALYSKFSALISFKSVSLNRYGLSRLLNRHYTDSTLCQVHNPRIIDACVVTTIDGHCLSRYNTIMCYMQAPKAPPVIVGGYRQWLAAGHQVNKGERGMTILFPVGPKEKTEDDEDVVSAERFLCATVFDISQTSEIQKEVGGV